MRTVLCIAVVLALGCRSHAPRDSADQVQMPQLPGVHVDLAAGYVELDAHVSPRSGDWLELIACAGRSLEHESLVTIDAQPSHVHLALLLLGLEPGKPQTWRQRDGRYFVDPAEGPAVAVYFVLDAVAEPIPAAAWVVNQQTGQPMGEARWLFAGSRFARINRERAYGADVNGPVVTLVHFGDEVLAPAGTDLTNRNDQQQWNAAAEQVPPAGTGLRLRLVPEP